MYLTDDFAENETRHATAISEGMQEMEATITLHAEIRTGRDHAVLRPCIDLELILSAMKTKQFENIVVIQRETAEDLVNDWTELLKRVKRIQAMLSVSN